jgi:hypothetical protein
MAVQGRNRSRGSNVEIQIYLNDVLKDFDDIDSLEISNNDNLLTYRPLGAVFNIHDIDIGDHNLDITCGKSGSNASRFYKEIEDRHKQAKSTLKGYIIVKIESRDGLGVEIQRYRDCVFQFPSTSFSDAGSEVTQKIKATSPERRFESFMDIN